MKHWKSILLLLLVFFAGIAVGVVGTRIVVRRVVQTITHPDRAQNVLEKNLTWRLRLDNEQQVKLHQILTDAHGQLQALRLEVQPQAALVLSNANEKITAMLTPEQQARYEKFKEHWPTARLLRGRGP